MTSPKLEAAAASTRTEADVRATKAAHTAGPWKLEGNWTISAKPLGGWVSTIHPSPLFELNPLTGSSEEIIANARLIAAAPDLLASLIAVTDELERIAVPEDGIGKARHAARAAIAKATGAA